MSNLHRNNCAIPKISTLLKATQKGFLKWCPNISERLILRYLNPSPATAKGHMKCPQHGIKSRTPKPLKITQLHVPIISSPAPQPAALLQHPVLPLFQEVPMYLGPTYGTTTGPNLIGYDDNELIANIFCFGAFANKQKWHCVPKSNRIIPIHVV
jgi:hypothetical protein